MGLLGDESMEGCLSTGREADWDISLGVSEKWDNIDSVLYGKRIKLLSIKKDK